MDCISVKVNDVIFNMLPVEGGHFLMGATPEQHSDAWDNESPVHSVEVDDYYIGETVVTQALWNAVMGGGEDNRSELPQTGKDWNEWQTFLTKLSSLTGRNFRLPTEAEWENAARGGNKSQGCKYAGSNSLDEVAWLEINSGGRIQKVKRKAPNELGLYDMSGNVWEWCSDWYDLYTSSEEEELCSNPKGPLSGTQRVVRGACCTSSMRLCRVSSRMGVDPKGKTYAFIGLRLALDKSQALKSVIPPAEKVQEKPKQPDNPTVGTAQTSGSKVEKPKPNSKPKGRSDDKKKKIWPLVLGVIATVFLVVLVINFVTDIPNKDDKMFDSCMTIEDYRQYVSEFGDDARHYEEAMVFIEKYERDSIAQVEQRIAQIEQRIASIQKLLAESREILKSNSIKAYDLQSYQEKKAVMNEGWEKLDLAFQEADLLPGDRKSPLIKEIEILREEYRKIVSDLHQKEQNNIDRSTDAIVRKEGKERMEVLEQYKSYQPNK